MGIRYEFKCQTCRMTAMVSGGDDQGNIAATRTMYCWTCATLRDVVTGYADEPGTSWPGAEEHRFGECEACGGDVLSPWLRGDACPRCGGLVEIGTAREAWD